PRRHLAEEMTIAKDGSLLCRRDGEALPNRGHVSLGRLASGAEGKARSLDHLPQCGGTNYEHLVSAAFSGGNKGQEGIQMTGAAKRAGSQYAHAGSLRTSPRR